MKVSKKYFLSNKGKDVHLFTTSQDSSWIYHELANICKEINYFFCYIGGKGIHNKSDLIKNFESSLRFPSEMNSLYPNWDASRDDLLDLYWLFDPPPSGDGYAGCIIFFSDPQVLISTSERDFVIFFEILSEASEMYQRENNISLYSLLGPAYPLVEELLRKADVSTCWVEIP